MELYLCLLLLILLLFVLKAALLFLITPWWLGKKSLVRLSVTLSLYPPAPSSRNGTLSAMQCAGVWRAGQQLSV